MKQIMLCCLLMLPVMGPAAVAAEPSAQQPAAPIAWNSLTPAQQQVLSQFESRWDQLPPQRQFALSRGAERWGSMDDAQKARAQERFQRWRGLLSSCRTRPRRCWG